MAASSNLAHVLEQTLNPLYAKEGNVSTFMLNLNRDTAESKLKIEARTQPDFLTNLLTLIAAPEVSIPVRQASALFFKNFVRANWKVLYDFGVCGLF